nr:EOG090X0MUO [Triops cancriformis]
MLLTRAILRLKTASPLTRVSPLNEPIAKTRCLTDFTKLRNEPEYLDSLAPEISIYPTLDIQLKSYDFPILESYMSFVHRTAENMGVEVEDCWATPGRSFNIQTFKPQSSLVQAHYSLQQYERNVQVTDLPSNLAPLLFEVIQQTLPPGVEVCVKEHTPSDEDIRYVPDLQLKELRTQLEAMGGPSNPKKKN